MSQPETMISKLHYELIRNLVEHCKVPSREELQLLLECSSSELDLAFDQLAASHGVVLHPDRREVWAIHPFSLAPTPFLVQSGSKMWWGNCAWCSLGIAVLVKDPCVITTTLGAETEQVQFTVADGRVDRDDLVVHFPIPMTKAWDNVIYTCSCMLMFRDKKHVAEWTARHGIPQGDIQPVTKVLELARRWYGEHLSSTWTKISMADARAIFSSLGLSHPAWHLPSLEGEF